MVLIVIAIINLQQGDSVETMKVLLRLGSALVGLSWLILVIWAFVALVQKRKIPSRPGMSAMSDGTLVSLRQFPYHRDLIFADEIS